MKKFIITIGAAAIIALPAAAFAQNSPQALQDAFVAAVEAEDAAALAALYTEDADSYGPGGGDRTTGRAAIAEGWTHFFDGFDNFSSSLDEHGSLDMGKKGHAAWGLWTMSATPVDGGDPVIWNGRFLDVQVKTKDGSRYRVDHASMLTPDAAEEPAAE